jgi:hypothetical protein
MEAPLSPKKYCIPRVARRVINYNETQMARAAEGKDVPAPRRSPKKTRKKPASTTTRKARAAAPAKKGRGKTATKKTATAKANIRKTRTGRVAKASSKSSSAPSKQAAVQNPPSSPLGDRSPTPPSPTPSPIPAEPVVARAPNEQKKSPVAKKGSTHTVNLKYKPMFPSKLRKELSQPKEESVDEDEITETEEEVPESEEEIDESESEEEVQSKKKGKGKKQ